MAKYRQSNTRRVRSPSEERRISSRRQIVETTFSCITGLLPRYIRACTGRGYLLRVMSAVLAYNSDCYLIDIGRLRDGGCWFARCDEANSLCTIREEQRTNPAPPARGMANQVGRNLSLQRELSYSLEAGLGQGLLQHPIYFRDHLGKG